MATAQRISLVNLAILVSQPTLRPILIDKQHIPLFLPPVYRGPGRLVKAQRSDPALRKEQIVPAYPMTNVMLSQ
jgi:hypothetical protein